MGTYWDLDRDLELVKELDLGTGETNYDGFADYWAHPDLWVPGKVWFTDSDYPDAQVYTNVQNTTVFGIPFHLKIVYIDYPLLISVVQGITHYTGYLWADFDAMAPASYYADLTPPPATAKDWTITDGTQVIYFSREYEGNYVEQFLGNNRTIYKGYGDDDDGSWISDLPNWEYDISFAGNTTGPVVVSPFPHPCVQFLALSTAKMKVFTSDFEYRAPTGTGDVKLFYTYRPLDQPGIVRDRWSLQFDGNTERLTGYPTAQALGIANEWTILTWVKPQGNGSNEQQVFCHGNDSNPNRIHLYRNTQDADEPWVIDIMDDSANQKTYEFGADLDLHEWYLIGAKYTGGDLYVYVNGVAVTPSNIISDDTLAAMTDSNRHMGVGGKSMLTATDGFDGLIHSAMSWSVGLGEDEILYLYNNPYGSLLRDQGDYESSSSLEHWYRNGMNESPDLGTDYGNTPFDLDAEVDIDDTNIVDDYPGSGIP